MMSDISKLGMSIAALGPKITLLCIVIGVAAGGSPGIITGAIVGGVLGGACVLIGGGLMFFGDCCLDYIEQQELENNDNDISPSTALINSVTNENRIESQRVVSNDIHIAGHPVENHANNQPEPSWFDNFTSFFSFEDKPNVVHANNTSNLSCKK
jgi:hypothetical protein